MAPALLPMVAPAILLQPGFDLAEHGIEAVAQQADRGDDRNRDARGNRAILDRGGAGLPGRLIDGPRPAPLLP